MEKLANFIFLINDLNEIPKHMNSNDQSINTRHSSILNRPSFALNH